MPVTLGSGGRVTNGAVASAPVMRYQCAGPEIALIGESVRCEPTVCDGHRDRVTRHVRIYAAERESRMICRATGFPLTQISS